MAHIRATTPRASTDNDQIDEVFAWNIWTCQPDRTVATQCWDFDGGQNSGIEKAAHTGGDGVGISRATNDLATWLFCLGD